MTGNTHRAEFCIDKLYPPEGQGLRPGLLELRAFEMPPHFRMGLVQMLLVRALVASSGSSRTAAAAPLGSHAARPLHAAALCAQDFGKVLGFLRGAGFAFDDDWFRRTRSSAFRGSVRSPRGR